MGGASSLRISTHDVQALEFARRLLAHIEYAGLAMVEFRRRADTGIAQFVEINGRLWGSIALALHAGVDFPAAYVRSELGDDQYGPQPTYPAGLTCRHVPGEASHVLSALKDRNVTMRQKIWKVAEFALLSADPRIHHDCFWRTDPGPGFAAAGEMVVSFVRRLRHRMRKARAPESQRGPTAYVARGGRKPENILFLCYGNICRSPFAEVFWNGQLRAVDAGLPRAHSAGFIAESGRRTPAIIAGLMRDAFDVDVSGHRSRLVTEADVELAEAIFVMDRRNYQDVERRFPQALAKTFFLGASGHPPCFTIADPYGMANADDVRAVCGRIATAARALSHAWD